jgi:hypothetical protein
VDSAEAGRPNLYRELVQDTYDPCFPDRAADWYPAARAPSKDKRARAGADPTLTPVF